MSKHEVFIIGVIAFGLAGGTVVAMQPQHAVVANAISTIKLKYPEGEVPLPRPCQSASCSPSPTANPQH